MKGKIKNSFDVKRIQKRIDFLNKNPHLKISIEGLSEKEILELFKKHFSQ
jgi:hypothetical protein